MKLLIITQKVNREDPVLGFFHRWIVEFAKHFSFITVICLEKGAHDLPSNVKVLSLGKETRESRAQYLARFYSHIWHERRNYDVVLSHMNQEYVLLAGWLWKVMGKRIYMWRNHHVGDELTDMAAVFCDKVFCTSRFSYTSKYKKAVIMPVGVDTSTFQMHKKFNDRHPKSVLFLSRIAPVKRPEVFIEALESLKDKGLEFQASIVGDPNSTHHEYYESIKRSVADKGLSDRIVFKPGIPNYETVPVYNDHQFFVNVSSSGMYDKTIFEAMACGTLVLTSNKNLEGEIDSRFFLKENSSEDLASKLKVVFSMPKDESAKISNALHEYVVKKHSLEQLGKRLALEMDVRHNSSS